MESKNKIARVSVEKVAEIKSLRQNWNFCLTAKFIEKSNSWFVYLCGLEPEHNLGRSFKSPKAARNYMLALGKQFNFTFVVAAYKSLKDACTAQTVAAN